MNIKTRFLAYSLALVLVSTARAQIFQQVDSSKVSSSNMVAEVNMLENGGLEEWNSLIGMPKDWIINNLDNVKQERNIKYEGKYSVKMQSKESGSTARIDQRIAVTPGQKMRIRFRYYVEQWKSKGARTYSYFRTDAAEAYNISADELQAFYSKEQYYIIRGGGYGKTYFPHELNVWQTFDETIVVPPTAHYFVFGVNSYYGTTIYIDDCWVIEVTDTITKGDVNGDGVVDLADIVAIANALLDTPSEGYDAIAADVNGDGEVTPADIVAIAGIIQETAVEPVTGDVNGDGTVDVGDIATIISTMAPKARMQKDMKE